MTGGLFLLFESASGYALFEVLEAEEIGSKLDHVQKSVKDLKSFSTIVKLKKFLPFATTEEALMNINDISEGLMSETLSAFLQGQLPKMKSSESKPKYKLGVSDKGLANAIKESLGIPCTSTDVVLELMRGIRLHFTHFVKGLDHFAAGQAQLGLGHNYSRAKVKFNVNRVDNMIIQSICLLDQLDKDLNTFSMRIKEWYGWHFPELKDLVKDNYQYARVVQALGERKNMDERQENVEKIVLDSELTEKIRVASHSSMGQDLSPTDLISVNIFAERVVSLCHYREQLVDYLHHKMNQVAPNLSALIGDTVGARLISHSGSLTNLSKCPASTIQILGAEKALFRALKTRGNTPKYGIIFHSSFIGRAGAKNKGRISRYLANKCAIASRLDSFLDAPTSEYGEEMKKQVEDRLSFFDTGIAPPKNIDVMERVTKKLHEGEPESEGKKKTKKDKKKKSERSSEGDDEVVEKKKRKHPSSEKSSSKSKASAAEPEEPASKPKKKKAKIVA